MRYSSRFFLYTPIAVLLVLVSVAMVNWWIVASAYSKHLEALNGHEIIPGVRIGFDSKRIAGFPFRLDTLLSHLRVEVAEKRGPIVWTTENFAMHELTYGRRQSILEAAGQQTLSWHDGHGELHRFSFLPGTFRASAVFFGGAMDRFDAQIVDLDGADFRAGDAELHLRKNHGAIDAYLKVERAHMPAGYAAALGPDLELMTASASLDHQGALDDLLYGNSTPMSALDGWAGIGGKVTVNRLTIRWKHRSAGFSGRLVLDSEHYLSGGLTGVVTNASTGARESATLTATGNRLALDSGLPRP